MSLLIFVKRHQAIIARKNELNFKLNELNRKLMDLQSYASSIADGSVSINDLMNAPSSQFQRLSLFMTAGHQVGLAGAQEQYAMSSPMTNQMLAQMQDPSAQAQYRNLLFNSYYKQAKEKFAEQETKILNAQDKKIEMEKAQIEQQLKMLESEEETVKKAEADGAKNAAPQYVA